MRKDLIDLTGKRFGRLIVTGLADTLSNKRRWNCQCDCGKKSIARSQHLRGGHTQSCGCLYDEMRGTVHNLTHGHAIGEGTPEYRTWQSMRRRCEDPHHKDFKNYAGRGIAVCPRWAKFENFLADMGLKPSPEMTINRKNNGGNYEPGNCEWASESQQQNNRRNNRKIEFNGRTLTTAQWARELGMADKRISHRLSRGWSIERALTQPIKTR